MEKPKSNKTRGEALARCACFDSYGDVVSSLAPFSLAPTAAETGHATVHKLSILQFSLDGLDTKTNNEEGQIKIAKLFFFHKHFNPWALMPQWK